MSASRVPRSSIDDRRAIVVIDDSAVVTAAYRAAACLDRAAEDSVCAIAASKIAALLVALPAWERVRLTASMLLTAVAVHVLLTRFDAPEPTVPARVAWVVVALLLVSIAGGARAVSAAWTDRIERLRGQGRTG